MTIDSHIIDVSLVFSITRMRMKNTCNEAPSTGHGSEPREVNTDQQESLRVSIMMLDLGIGISCDGKLVREANFTGTGNGNAA